MKATSERSGIPARGERGYNLIEVIIASALLAIVLIAIVTLFVLGGERIKSGKELTKATAQGMDVMEDFRGFPFEWGFRVINGRSVSPCDTTKTWKTTDPMPAWAAENQPSTDYQAVLQKWKDDVENLFRTPTGSTGVIEFRVDGFRSVPADTSAGDTCFGEARYLRVRVIVRWKEVRNRNRNVTFETLKF